MEDAIPTSHEHGAKAAHTAPKKPVNRKKILTIAGGVILLGIIIGAIYVIHASKYIYIDKASIDAPTIELAPSQGGVLEELDVHEGDIVGPNTTVARVGNELIKTKTDGIVVSVQNNIGATFAPGQAVVDIINPDDLRVVGRLDETKGLDEVKVGQAVDFTVDAFGGKTYHAIVDEVAPTARSTALSFSISDTRPVQEFEVKARYDTSLYPELKNGMSARMWVYK